MADVIPDPLAALVSFCEASTELGLLVSNRIFGAELPDSEALYMPRKALVLREVGDAGRGALLGASYVRLGTIRLETQCWGETPHQAARVHWAVYELLKQMRRNVQGSALLHWANPEGGPLVLRDPDTEWPSRTCTWQVMVAEMEVP